MKRKILFSVVMLFIIIDFFIYFYLPSINFYNIEFIQPLFWTLIPLIFLLFLLSFLKNINLKSVLTTILIFGIVVFFIISQTDSICSQIICLDRNLAALILSSIFSIIYFIVQFIKNRKQPV